MALPNGQPIRNPRDSFLANLSSQINFVDLDETFFFEIYKQKKTDFNPDKFC